MLNEKPRENAYIIVNALCIIFQECDDRLSRSTPILLPVLLDLYRASWENTIKDKIIEVVGLCLESLSWADGIDQGLVERALSSVWWSWYLIFSETINSASVSLFTKQKVFKLLTCFYRDFTIFSQPWVNGMIPIVWLQMYSFIPVYAEKAIFNKEEAVVNETSEDSACGVEGAASQLLELISCVVVRPSKNEGIIKELSFFVNSLLWYIMLTVEQQELWDNEPNQFIVEDDADEG